MAEVVDLAVIDVEALVVPGDQLEWEALADPVFFNKNIRPDEISSLIMILPAMVTDIPDYQEILDQIDDRIDNVVCLEEPIKDWSTVIFDRAAAARTAVEHLIKLGHQRIAFLAIEDDRLQGYRQSLLDHKLQFDKELVFPLNPSDMLESAYQSTVKILNLPKPPSKKLSNLSTVRNSKMLRINLTLPELL